jgi:hypothetical protein
MHNVVGRRSYIDRRKRFKSQVRQLDSTVRVSFSSLIGPAAAGPSAFQDFLFTNHQKREQKTVLTRDAT